MSGGGYTGVAPLPLSIEGYLTSTMKQYAHCFRSTADRFAEEGKDRDYFHSAQVRPTRPRDHATTRPRAAP